MELKIRTPEEFMKDWIQDYALCGPWDNEEVIKFARDYNAYVHTEEEKWFDSKDNNEIEDLMKKVEKFMMKGMIIAFRGLAKKQGLQIPKHLKR